MGLKTRGFCLIALSLFIFFALMLMPRASLAWQISGNAGLPYPVINGDCIVGLGDVPMWGNCSTGDPFTTADEMHARFGGLEGEFEGALGE